MEAERLADIEFLLPRIYELSGDTNDNLPPILLVGYGAGGSALAYLNDKGVFASNNNLLGIIAVESRLWVSYQAKSSDVSGASSIRNLMDVVDRLPGFLPKTVNLTKALPSANLPVLYLVSSKALKYPSLDYGEGKNPYQAIFDTERLASGSIAIAIIEETSPLDYQDFPLTHPIYSFALPGMKDTANFISDTASIIGNFASLLLEQSTWTEPENDDSLQPVTIILPRSPINGSLYVERKGKTWLKL